jgi:anti-anti-sigma regulatory factor
VEALKASRNLGVRFILFGLSTPAREVLQLSRLIKVFEISETEDQEDKNKKQKAPGLEWIPTLALRDKPS